MKLKFHTPEESRKLSARNKQRFEKLDVEINGLIHDIANAGLEIGKRLKEIDDGNLFMHGGFGSIVQYAKVKYHLAKAYTYKLLAAANVIKGLTKKCTAVHSPILLPANEWQIRPMAVHRIVHHEVKIKEVWDRAVKNANGSDVTSKHVREAVNALYPASEGDKRKEQTVTKYSKAKRAVDDLTIAETKQLLKHLTKKLEG